MGSSNTSLGTDERGRLCPPGRGQQAGPHAHIGTGARETGEFFPPITVVIVTFQCAEFIAECLASVTACGYPNVRMVIVDNASADATADAIVDWASSTPPPLGDNGMSASSIEVRSSGGATQAPSAAVTLLRLRDNAGFAGGVNIGLTIALADCATDLVWILNPDTVTEPQTPFALARKAMEMGRFAVIGGRVLYLEAPAIVQTDGGRLHALGCTGVSVNIGADVASAPMPDVDTLAYIPGVSMLVSRTFIETVGLMPEHWFLYFEEIDWQLARGDLPLGLCGDARVLHQAGGSIGSGAVHRRASSLSVYFTCRNLLPFVLKWARWKLPFAYALAYYKLIFQWGPSRDNIVAAFRGLHRLGPPGCVRRHLSDATWAKVLRGKGERSSNAAVGSAA